VDKLREAARQALGALVRAEALYGQPNADIQTALREALAEPDIEEMTLTQIAARHEQAEQEPVLCVECGKPTMHMGNKCYACCQKDTKDLEDALKSWDAAPVRTKDLTDDEIWEIWFKDITLDWDERCRAVIAKFKEKNAPVQREQQEPVAWALMHKNGLEFNTGYGMVETLQQAEDMQRRHLGNLKIVPLYTTPPSVEAAIEATKEKAAKLIDNEEIHRGKWFATAIRSMK